MTGFVREHALPLTLSVLLHAAVIGLLVFGFLNLRHRPMPQPQLALDAAVVDEKQVAEEMRRLDQDEQRRRDEERQERERADEAKREREAEEQRLAELKQEAEQQEAQQREQAAAEAKRKAEAEAVAAAELKRKADAQAKAAADKKRKDAEAKQKAEREAELKRSMAEEERRAAAVSSGALAQYIAQIQARIQSKWIRPPSARAGLNCVVNVKQVPGGEVTEVRIGECNGDDAVRQSIEDAVYRASPLPVPSDPSLFERSLRLEFKPDQ